MPSPAPLTPSLLRAVCRALRHAAALGFTCAVTGDGADELFGGYSFTHRQRCASAKAMGLRGMLMAHSCGVRQG